MGVLIEVQFSTVTRLLDEARALEEAARRTDILPIHRNAFLEAARERRLKAMELTTERH